MFSSGAHIDVRRNKASRVIKEKKGEKKGKGEVK